MKNKKTVLVTGASKGIGKSIALYFAERNWSVIAGVRNPFFEGNPSHENIEFLKIDVTNEIQIEEAVKTINDTVGSLDALVNNAGFGVFGAFMAQTTEQIENQFAVNFYGALNMIRAFLPLLQKADSGKVINVTSGSGITGFPMQTTYCATKYAVEGFTEALSFELDAVGVQVKLVLPGSIKTNFHEALVAPEIKRDSPFYDMQTRINANYAQFGEKGADPTVVSKEVFKAATSNSSKLRYLAGSDVRLIARLRKLLPFNLYRKILKSQIT